jgi:hypothetical protein
MDAQQTFLGQLNKCVTQRIYFEWSDLTFSRLGDLLCLGCSAFCRSSRMYAGTASLCISHVSMRLDGFLGYMLGGYGGSLVPSDG